MNLLNKRLIKFKNNGVKIIRESKGLRLINDTNTHGFVLCPRIFDSKNKNNVFVNFQGEIVRGNGAILQVLSSDRRILSETSFNATSTCSVDVKYFLLTIKISSHSEV